jgi:hypothetical protein
MVQGTCHRGFASYFSWGGKALRGDDGKAHLFASFMCRHKDLGAWTTDSASAHFVADELDGAYAWAEVDCSAGGVCVAYFTLVRCLLYDVCSLSDV